MVKATTKRERKYGKKESEVLTPKAPKLTKGRPPKQKFRVMIDRANFYHEFFKSYEDAAQWIAKEDKRNHGECIYSIMEV